MTGSTSKTLPPCLPNFIKAQIWDQVISAEKHKPLIAGFMDGLVEPTDDIAVRFIRIAMSDPHFATQTEIQYGLNIGYGKCRRLMELVRMEARESRK